MRNEKKLNKLPTSCMSLFKSRCKYCKSKPQMAFIKANCILLKDFYFNKQIYNYYTNNIIGFLSYEYENTAPSIYNKINVFSYNLLFNKINIRNNKNYGYNKYYSNIIDSLYCECGKTTWLFNKTNGINNELINQKRLKNNY